MRILHVSDWHVGKTNGWVEREPDHVAVLGEVEAIAKDSEPDLIGHTGDVFDRFRPGDKDLFLAIDALKKLERVAPVLVIRGNHDSERLFAVFRRLNDAGRLYFVERPRHPKDGGIYDFTVPSGRIRVAPLPFIHAGRALPDAFIDPADMLATYTDKIAAIEKVLGEGLHAGVDWKRDVLIFAAHLFVSGAVIHGKGEDPRYVTDGYRTRLEHLPQGIAYGAFGHIHKPQKLPGATLARYAGSPIPIDFGEEGESKSVTVVEAAPGKVTRAKPLQLSGGRALLHVHATLDEIASKSDAIGDAIVRVLVKSEEPILNLADAVVDRLPRATILDSRLDCPALRPQIFRLEDVRVVEDEQMEDVFRDYLKLQGTQGVGVDTAMKVFADLYGARAEESAPSPPSIDALSSFLVAHDNTAPQTDAPAPA